MSHCLTSGATRRSGPAPLAASADDRAYLDRRIGELEVRARLRR